LGLAITRNAVELHGGEIAFESVEGQGTVFTVRLPVEQVAEPAP
jgi:signal transduction histidine kinase